MNKLDDQANRDWQVLSRGDGDGRERRLSIDERHADEPAWDRNWKWNGRRRVQEPELQVPEPRGTARQGAGPVQTSRRAEAHHYRFQSADKGRFGTRYQQEQGKGRSKTRQIEQIAIFYALILLVNR